MSATEKKELERLVNLVSNSNLIGLDKALACCRVDKGYAAALYRIVQVRDRMEQAAIEVQHCLPRRTLR